MDLITNIRIGWVEVLIKVCLIDQAGDCISRGTRHVIISQERGRTTK